MPSASDEWPKHASRAVPQGRPEGRDAGWRRPVAKPCEPGLKLGSGRVPGDTIRPLDCRVVSHSACVGYAPAYRRATARERQGPVGVAFGPSMALRGAPGPGMTGGRGCQGLPSPLLDGPVHQQWHVVMGGDHGLVASLAAPGLLDGPLGRNRHRGGERRQQRFRRAVVRVAATVAPWQRAALHVHAVAPSCEPSCKKWDTAVVRL